MEIILIVLSVAILSLAVFAYKLKSKINHYKQRYEPIIDIDEEVQKLKKEKIELDKAIKDVRQSYKEKRSIFDDLVKEIAIYDEEIELVELGFYKPHFDFDSSEKYKDAINQVKQQQKELISLKEAIYCTTEWTVQGSKRKGQTMTNRGIRLTARAFNNECEAAIAKVKWNNAEKMEQRIQKAFTAVNKLNSSNEIDISTKYLDLKIQEVRLTHEYAEKKQQEKEEQAEARRQMREEAKLEKEFQKAVKDEENYQKLLNKAKSAAEKASGDKLAELQAKINQLDQELKEAQEKSERAKSMAQQTKLGHIYVISNIGSFGKNIYKIGMTRRLEPMDRVRELGGASVPFLFDVHAMIYTKDAPALEKMLHNAFDSKKLNLVNNRKEFFAVSLDEIQAKVHELLPDTEFIKIAGARDYRESKAILAQREALSQKKIAETKFPEAI